MFKKGETGEVEGGAFGLCSWPGEMQGELRVWGQRSRAEPQAGGTGDTRGELMGEGEEEEKLS